MKSIGAGLVTAGVLTIVFCLVTACVVGHDPDQKPEDPSPASSPTNWPPACSDRCPSAAGVPTLAPPQPDGPESTPGVRIESRPRGQVVYVDVEVAAD